MVLRDTIKRYCFPQSLTTNYNCRFVQVSVSDYNCLYYSFTVGNSLRYRTDPAHQSFCHTKVLTALQFTAFFFCQMDDHIGITVPSNFCKSAIDCTRFSGCSSLLTREYANSCLLLKDSLRWDIKNHILLCLKFSKLRWLRRYEVSIFSCKLYSDIWHSRTSNKCSNTIIVILLTTN